MVSSLKAREAFNIGRSRPSFATNMAATRPAPACCWRGGWSRLVSRFVTMTYGGWDLHDNVQNGISGQLPAFDQGFAALIRDLDRRGLLEVDIGVYRVRVRPHAEDQRHGRPRPLAEGLHRGHGRRRHQGGHRRTVRRTRRPANRKTIRSRSRTGPRRFTTASASIPTRS